MTRKHEGVNIRPGVSILSVLKSLNYKPWFALAEFVDNALASFLANKSALRAAGSRRLRVEIEFQAEDGGRLVIRDNAAGIREADYARAFKPAQPPADRSGLSEFGMGMKSAACWFARRWTVRTCALGEHAERTLSFDIDSIVRNEIEVLEPVLTKVPPGSHHTEVVLEDLHQVPHGRTLGKMKQHLASIYRRFTRDGVLELMFNGEALEFLEPAVLRAPYYKTPKAPAETWRKDIEVDLGHKRTARGFAALRETGSTSEAGFALFRRGRLIQGSGDEGYRPESIFGRSNSYTYQRLFGELYLEGFEVSHTKDGIRWGEIEDAFLAKLHAAINEEPLQLISQAEGHRVRAKPAEVGRAAEAAVERTSEVIRLHAPSVIAEQLASSAPVEEPARELLPARHSTRRTIDVDLRGVKWRIIVELSADPRLSEWVDISDSVITDNDLDAKVRCIGVRLALLHPFTERFVGADGSMIEPFLRVAAALVLAETVARSGGAKRASLVRRHFNELLRTALSEP